MKKNPLKIQPVAFSANLSKMIKEAEKHPKPNSCLVVDVITDLMETGYKEWEKKYMPHKRQKSK